MKPTSLICLFAVIIFGSCKKEKSAEAFIGSYNIVAVISGGGFGPPQYAQKEYIMIIKEHPDSDDSLIIHNFAGLSQNFDQHITVTAFQNGTEFAITNRHLVCEECEEWLPKYKVDPASGYLAGDSIYFEYQYFNDIGDHYWGTASGVKIN